MHVILILSLLLIVLGGLMIFTLNRRGQKNVPTSEDKNALDSFVEDIREVLGEVIPDTQFEYNSSIDTFAPVVNSNDTEFSEAPNGMTLFLGNLRNRTQDMGSADRKEFLRSFLIQATSQTELTPELVKETLFMRCRTPEEFATRECLMNAKDSVKKCARQASPLTTSCSSQERTY